jgi:hypothetical protein
LKYALKDLDLIRNKILHSLDEKSMENQGIQKINREYEVKIREQIIEIEELQSTLFNKYLGKQDITLERIRNLE